MTMLTVSSVVVLAIRSPSVRVHNMVSRMCHCARIRQSSNPKDSAIHCTDSGLSMGIASSKMLDDSNSYRGVCGHLSARL